MSYYTIPNSGSVREMYHGREIRMYNQCFWISIQDYLAYCRGERRSIIEIKEMAGLDRDTDYKMADWENPIFRRGIERIAEVLNIQIRFYHMYLDRRQIDDAAHIVNETARDIVNIAFYGAHFEFIITGPNIASCRPHRNAPVIPKNRYEPKIYKKGTDFINMKDVNVNKSDRFMNAYLELMSVSELLDENKNALDKLEEGIQDIINSTREIEENEEYNTDEKKELLQLYSKEFTEKEQEYEELIKTNHELKQQYRLMVDDIQRM